MKSFKNNIFTLLFLAVTGLFLVVVFFPSEQALPGGDVLYEVDEAILQRAKNIGYGVATDNTFASQIGVDILDKGGNAVDAAIAISYALGVLEPHGSGIGGGGLMLVHHPNQDPIAYDYREIAPFSTRTKQSVGVPGFVKGMEAVHNDFGTIPLKNLIEPAIFYAENGFRVSKDLHNRLSNATYRLNKSDAPHLFPNGNPIAIGKTLIQEELANTLKILANEGSEPFYSGKLAENISRNVTRINDADLENYTVIKSEPIVGQFAGFSVLTPPPPSGGMMLIQSLQMAENLKIEYMKDHIPDFVQTVGEINRIAYRERIGRVGDPQFVEVPTDYLLSTDFTNALSDELLVKGQIPDYEVYDDEVDLEETTTHFVVIDQNGMMVSTTNTLSNFFGSGLYVDGYFLNNQLDNFTNDPTSPNAFAPGKRPFSYITPTIFTKNDLPIIGIGSAGGRRITTTLTQVLVRHLKFGEPLDEAINKFRSFRHVQGNHISIERSLPYVTERDITNRGYQIDKSQTPTFYGSVQSLIVDYQGGQIYGVADSRREGKVITK